MEPIKFDELDARMRALETESDARLPREGFLIARLDGRGFTRLTKELLALEKPFDPRFHGAMSETLALLFNCGFTLDFGYSQSDEISLLFASGGVPFERKTRKLLSVLAGEASAQFSLSLGARGAFDCRLLLLRSQNSVCDYFLWRQLDAMRNALSAHCYWLARAQGLSPKAATQRFADASQREKRAFLSENCIDFDGLPPWQTRGFGAFYQTFDKAANNPLTGQAVVATRKRLVFDRELPCNGDFTLYLSQKLPS